MNSETMNMASGEFRIYCVFAPVVNIRIVQPGSAGQEAGRLLFPAFSVLCSRASCNMCVTNNGVRKMPVIIFNLSVNRHFKAL